MSKMWVTIGRSKRGIDWKKEIEGLARKLKMLRHYAKTSKVNADARRHFPSIQSLALSGHGIMQTVSAV
jgi:hypothetical protein